MILHRAILAFLDYVRTTSLLGDAWRADNLSLSREIGRTTPAILKIVDAVDVMSPDTDSRSADRRVTGCAGIAL